MSMFSKLTRLAQKGLAAQQGSASRSPGSTAGSGKGGWQDLVRTAADALTGDSSPSRDGAPGTRTPSGQQPPAGRASTVGGTSGGAPVRGTAPTGPAGGTASGRSSHQAASTPASDADKAAVARYDYLLQTADPQQVEQVHREAFESLTPAQRSQIEARMQAELPAGEQPRSSGTDDLARAAARTEARQPGTLKGLLARAGGHRGGSTGSSSSGSAGGFGKGALVGGAAAGAAGLAAGGLLTAVAGGAVLSSVAGPLLEQAVGAGIDFDALGSAVDLDGIANGLEGLGGLDVAGGVDELTNGAGEAVSGFGEQIKDLESGFGLPGLDDLLGR